MDNEKAQKTVFKLEWHIWDMPETEAIHVTEYHSCDNKTGQDRILHLTIVIGEMCVPSKQALYLYDLLCQYRQFRANMAAIINAYEFRTEQMLGATAGA